MRYFRSTHASSSPSRSELQIPRKESRAESSLNGETLLRPRKPRRSRGPAQAGAQMNINRACAARVVHCTEHDGTAYACTAFGSAQPDSALDHQNQSTCVRRVSLRASSSLPGP